MVTALTIAGSDSGGGAGIQADLKAFHAVGVHGATAVTAVTSQNTKGVVRIDSLPPESVREQVRTVRADLDVRAIKTGMLHTPELVAAVLAALDDYRGPLVVDPVLAATSGDALARQGIEDSLRKLIGLATLATPNARELAALAGTAAETEDEAVAAAKRLLATGAQAVLVKGGHLPGDPVVDVLVTQRGATRLPAPRLPGEFHGAGCTYASLITGLLARGYALIDAVHEARWRMHRALAVAVRVGSGPAVPDALETNAPPTQGGLAGVLGAAAWRLAAGVPREAVPEVGTNLAFVPPGATTPDTVLGLSRRITRVTGGLSAPGPVVAGGSGHVARVALAANRHDPRLTSALNLKHRPEYVDRAKRRGLAIATFDRADQPPDAKTLDWGMEHAIRAAGTVPDLVWDAGAPGKEAMIRLLGPEPGAVVETALDLCRST